MIKSYQKEQWQTLHKNEWEERFVYEVSNLTNAVIPHKIGWKLDIEV